MVACPQPVPELPSSAQAFYRRALLALNEAGVPYLLGGAYAFTHYTGIVRHTKDLDVFVRREHCAAALRVLAEQGYRTEIKFSHWLAKAYDGDAFIDVIFGAGNGVAGVDNAWFVHAVEGEVWDVPVLLSPPEEAIWSKAFIMERERYDGADIAHLIRALGPDLDWNRLIARFGAHWRVLLSHLVLYGFIYPTERERIPSWVMMHLLGKLAADEGSEPRDREPICNGTVLSRAQYLPDVEQWGYRDPRLAPDGTMTEEEVRRWTEAIGG